MLNETERIIITTTAKPAPEKEEIKKKKFAIFVINIPSNLKCMQRHRHTSKQYFYLYFEKFNAF